MILFAFLAALSAKGGVSFESRRAKQIRRSAGDLFARQGFHEFSFRLNYRVFATSVRTVTVLSGLMSDEE